MTIDRWWLADPTIWRRWTQEGAMTDDEITEAMMRYGGGFVADLGALFRRADPVNQAILRTAFAHIWTEYSRLRDLAHDGPPRCPRCGCYQWVYKGDRQVCRDCGRE